MKKNILIFTDNSYNFTGENGVVYDVYRPKVIKALVHSHKSVENALNHGQRVICTTDMAALFYTDQLIEYDVYVCTNGFYIKLEHINAEVAADFVSGKYNHDLALSTDEVIDLVKSIFLENVYVVVSRDGNELASFKEMKDATKLANDINGRIKEY